MDVLLHESVLPPRSCTNDVLAVAVLACDRRTAWVLGGDSETNVRMSLASLQTWPLRSSSPFARQRPLYYSLRAVLAHRTKGSETCDRRFPSLRLTRRPRTYKAVREYTTMVRVSVVFDKQYGRACLYLEWGLNSSSHASSSLDNHSARILPTSPGCWKWDGWEWCHPWPGERRYRRRGYHWCVTALFTTLKGK